MFKDIVGFEGKYQVSNIGEVKSIRYNNTCNERILKKNYDKYGYLTTHVSRYGNAKTYTIHRLVAQAFIPNPENKPQVNHINGIKTDNRVENLEWVTAKENTIHACNSGLCSNNHFKKNHPGKGKYGKECINAKKVFQYSKDGEFIKEWGSIVDASIVLCISRTAIGNACSGLSKTAGGFGWKYIFAK